jgi:hypothetical protein
MSTCLGALQKAPVVEIAQWVRADPLRVEAGFEPQVGGAGCASTEQSTPRCWCRSRTRGCAGGSERQGPKTRLAVGAGQVALERSHHRGQVGFSFPFTNPTGLTSCWSRDFADADSWDERSGSLPFGAREARHVSAQQLGKGVDLYWGRQVESVNYADRPRGGPLADLGATSTSCGVASENSANGGSEGLMDPAMAMYSPPKLSNILSV